MVVLLFSVGMCYILCIEQSLVCCFTEFVAVLFDALSE